ncbi:hypothetical protein ACFQWH_13695 [Mycolicibacterium sp. GCM10028919]|uniref:hypothetical protein n=1 Tax=Mycolicibacterium sp. GCM10028919 TaxID=3273401 RepID=UPI003623DF13
MSDQSAYFNEVAHMQLRAPRIVLVVPVTDDWHRIAMQGLHLVTTSWAGAGFVVVPTERGVVHPAILASLREYDPDCVLAPPAEALPADLADGVTRAQEAISAVCSNYRSPLLNPLEVANPRFSALWNIWFSTDGHPSSGDPVDVSTVSDVHDGETSIGANPALDGALGLAAASRWGLSETPNDDVADVEDSVKKAAVRRLSSHEYQAGGLPGIGTAATFEGRYETYLARTLVGLDGAQSYGPRRSDALIVMGDKPSDFALAMVWDRTYRYGIWVPEEWWADTDLRPHVIAGIDELVRHASTQLKRVLFTSTTLEESEIAARAKQWRDRTSLILEKDLDDKWMVVGADALAPSRYWKVHYVLKENISHEWSTAVTTEAGTANLSMLPPLPRIGVPGLEPLEQSTCWHVDVSLRGYDLPVSIALPEDTLLVETTEAQATRVRAGRGGISYQAHRTDFIPSGASLSQSLARPLLSFPSLIHWANSRASTHAMSVRLSTAGTQANVLASMMGSREALTDLVASDFLAALLAFNRSRSTKDDYPGGEGCVVNSEGYLHFSGICTIAGVTDTAEARDRVDGLLKAGVLRRGLLTKCLLCQHSAFVHVDDLASMIRCDRCLEVNALERQLWLHPVEEPTWYYDLHPIARKLLQDNGDVPLLLSKYLRSTSQRSYTDAAEFELLGSEGDPVCETDLLALTDRRLSMAEAKSSNTFGSRRQRMSGARKRVIAAHALQVDEIVLATTAAQWEGATIEAMKTAMLEQDWRMGRTPDLRIICSLGGAVTDDTQRVR